MTAPRPFALVLMLSLALLAMGAAPGRAATGELFAAEVEVPDASAEARGEGVVDAFATVLTKVTGRPDAESFAAWPQLRDAADRLMIEYRYRTEAPPSSVAEPTAPPRTLLYVRFDRQGIESLLRQNRLPLWGDTRPATLLLLAVERGTERFIYTPDAMPEAARAISEASKRRGIPIVEPLMDLEDRGMLRFNEVWGGFPEVIEQVTARYAQDALLVGRLFSEGGDAWRAQWTLHVDGARDQWQSQGALAETLREGVHGLADLLARRYVPDAASAEERVALAVTGIRNPEDYARVMAFLGGMTSISAVRPRLADHERLELELVTDVPPDALLRTIGLGGTLVPADLPGQGRDTIPQFRLRP